MYAVRMLMQTNLCLCTPGFLASPDEHSLNGRQNRRTSIEDLSRSVLLYELVTVDFVD
jgi:hypothetical protein